MKNIMLLACGLFIALAQTTVSAQDEKTYLEGVDSDEYFNDTLMIYLSNGNKIIITGNTMQNLVDYHRADSVKLLFITDYDKALVNQALPSNAQLIHYFVHSSGKRRLKAEAAEYSDNKINVEYEITRLDLELPKYEYHLHDLLDGITLQVYLNNPDDLKTALGSISITEAIKEAAGNKKDYRKHVRLDLKAEGSSYKITGKIKSRENAIELNPVVGIGLLGNTFAPVLGAEISLRLSDKYAVGKYKIGIGFQAFPFVHTVAGEISGVSFVRSYELKLIKNLNAGSRKKPFWFGVQGGFMNSNEISSFNNAYKIGIIYESNGPFNYSFDYIRDKNDNTVYGLTIRMPF